MNLTDPTGRSGHGAPGKGNIRRRRILRHDQKALRTPSMWYRPRNLAATIANDVPLSEAMTRYISGVILY